MSRMVEDLLLLAKSDQASLPYEFETVEVEPVLAELAGRAAVLARRPQRTLRRMSRRTPPAIVAPPQDRAGEGTRSPGGEGDADDAGTRQNDRDEGLDDDGPDEDRGDEDGGRDDDGDDRDDGAGNGFAGARGDDDAGDGRDDGNDADRDADDDRDD